jgi:hypothetical protein
MFLSQEKKQTSLPGCADFKYLESGSLLFQGVIVYLVKLSVTLFAPMGNRLALPVATVHCIAPGVPAIICCAK